MKARKLGVSELLLSMLVRQVGLLSARIQRLLHVCYSVRVHAIDIVTRMAFSHLISALACSWPECVRLVIALRIARHDSASPRSQ